MRFHSGWWLVSASLILAGCGGGGSGTPPPSAPTVTAVSPTSGATGVAVTSTVTATFSTAMNPSTITATTFTLAAQGGTAVTGTVTYSSASNSATFTPGSSLASGTTYTATITTGAQSSSGTALAAIFTSSFTTAAGAPPTVIGTSPGNIATGVPIETTVTATFSEAMNAATITSSTFTLVPQGGTAVAATYSTSGDTATLTPSSPLLPETIYTATLTTGVAASDGAALAGGVSWSFTTGGTPPTVTAVTPANNATGVAISSTVTATFSEAISASTLTSSTFTLKPQGGSAVTGTVSYDSSSMTATFTPSAPLNPDTLYAAVLTTGIMASDGTALLENYSWAFTTAVPTAPIVTAVTPMNGATNIDVSAPAVGAVFSEAMNASSINTSTFTLSSSGGAVAGTVVYSAGTNTAAFTPSANLAYNTEYTATITTGATAANGATLAAPYSWTFTTTTPPVPAVTATVPASGATNVVATNALTATFSQPMNAGTITTSTFTLATTSGDTPVAGTVIYTSGTQMATFTPSAALAYSTSYTATITTGATSSAGAALASNYSWNFTTGSAPNAATVDFGTTYQTIRGFGGSTAWLGPLTTAQATELFSPTASASSLGLSILRVRIDPEGTAAGGGTYGDPFETGEWDQELTNAQEAVAANPNAIVFASPWTPPAIWKLSGSSTTVDGNTFNEAFYSPSTGCSPAGDSGAYCGGYLDPNHYADYANYLEDFVTFFDSEAGFNLYAISMQNEPEENVDYESCIWTPAQMDAFVASLTSGGATNPITTKLIMPEADSFQAFQAETTLEDASAAPNVSIVGGHLYGASPYAPPSYYSGKDIWMTEHYLNPSNGSGFAIADALAAAEEVHNSLVTGQYNAYVWWWIWNDPNDGVDYGLINSSTTSPAPTSFGYGIGQFSRFIQPGFVRVSATASPVAGVYLSAYNYTGSTSYPDHYVIVAINSNTTTETLAFTLDNGSGVTSLTPYQTTSAVQLTSQTAVPVTSGQFTYTLPAQSIVTFVQ